MRMGYGVWVGFFFWLSVLFVRLRIDVGRLSIVRFLSLNMIAMGSSCIVINGQDDD